MAYQRKTRDEWHIETNHGDGWEFETAIDNRKEALSLLHDYREQSPSLPVRLIKKRVRIVED